MHESLLAQGIKITIKSWISNLIKLVQNDCTKRFKSNNLAQFLQNCESILYQQAYFATADKTELASMCDKAN